MATEHYVAGQDVTEWASMAKLKAGRLMREVPDACLQFWGGMGYTWDNPVSRLYRDGRLLDRRRRRRGDARHHRQVHAHAARQAMSLLASPSVLEGRPSLRSNPTQGRRAAIAQSCTGCPACSPGSP